MLLSEEGLHKKGFDYMYKSLSAAKSNGFKLEEGFSCLEAGRILKQIGKAEQASKYFKRGKRILNKAGAAV